MLRYVHEFIFQLLLVLSLVSCAFFSSFLPSSSSSSLFFHYILLLFTHSSSRKRMFMRSQISIIWALAFSLSRFKYTYVWVSFQSKNFCKICVVCKCLLFSIEHEMCVISVKKITVCSFSVSVWKTEFKTCYNYRNIENASIHKTRERGRERDEPVSNKERSLCTHLVMHTYDVTKCLSATISCLIIINFFDTKIVHTTHTLYVLRLFQWHLCA